MLDTEDNFDQDRNAKKTMTKLLRIAGMKKSLGNIRLGARLFLDLANISTRLKMYPLAMNCYSQALRLNNKKEVSPENDTQNIFDSARITRFFQTDSVEITDNMPARIHRSFIIPINKITSYNGDIIVIENAELLIFRLFKQNVLRKLQLKSNS